MSMIFQNAVALGVTCNSDECGDSMQCMIFDHNEHFRDYLLKMIRLVEAVKRRYHEAYWIDFGDCTPTLIKIGYNPVFDEMDSIDVVYVPHLVLPDDAAPRQDYMTMRVDESGVKWKVGIKHSNTEWESTWFSKSNIVNYVSPVRALIDRWRASHGES